MLEAQKRDFCNYNQKGKEKSDYCVQELTMGHEISKNAIVFKVTYLYFS